MNPMIHEMAVAIFHGFKRTAQAGGQTTDAEWENLTPNLKRVMYSYAHDAYKAQRDFILHNPGVRVDYEFNDNQFLALMKNPL